MSFRAPRPPRLAPATPQRRRRVLAGVAVRIPQALKKAGYVMRLQVDVRVGGKVYTQRRPHKVVRSTATRPDAKIPPFTQPQSIDKRLLEWDCWSSLIPALIPMYMDLLCRSKNLLSIGRDTRCCCACVGRRCLEVTVYGFDGTSVERIRMIRVWISTD